MQYFSKFACVVLSAALLLNGCKGKDGDPGPAGTNGTAGPTGPIGPSGQNLIGNIYGFVFPVDEYGAATARSGVTVTLDGVTPAAISTTNADGRYEFIGVRNGTYNLTFSRTGLGALRRLGVAHVGGDQPTFLGTSTISATTTTSVGTISVTNLSPTGVQLFIPFTNAGAPAGFFNRFVAFISATPGATAVNGTPLFLPSSSVSPLVTNISKATLNSLGFASGTAVYLVVYGTPNFLAGFNDPLTGRVIYSGLSAAPSNQLAFIIP